MDYLMRSVASTLLVALHALLLHNVLSMALSDYNNQGQGAGGGGSCLVTIIPDCKILNRGSAQLECWSWLEPAAVDYQAIMGAQEAIESLRGK